MQYISNLICYQHECIYNIIGKFPVEVDTDDSDFLQNLHKVVELPEPVPVLPAKKCINNALNNPDLPPPLPPKPEVGISYAT